MKILSKEESANMITKKSRHSEISEAVIGLKNGESLFITIEEWRAKGYKNEPVATMANTFYRLGKKVSQVKTPEGYLLSLRDRY